MKPKIAIATGDPAGIGPEISLKAARDPRIVELCECEYQLPARRTTIPILRESRRVISLT